MTTAAPMTISITHLLFVLVSDSMYLYTKNISAMTSIISYKIHYITLFKMACRIHSEDFTKFDKNTRFINIVLNALQYMCDFQVFPNKFNTSEMYALIKDPNKSTSDMANIRGISVSDLFTNIFEKLMLLKINEKLKTNKNKEMH